MLQLLILFNKAGLCLYEVPFDYWEWEEGENNVLELENFGMGKIILKQQTIPNKRLGLNSQVLS